MLPFNNDFPSLDWPCTRVEGLKWLGGSLLSSRRQLTSEGLSLIINSIRTHGVFLPLVTPMALSTVLALSL